MSALLLLTRSLESSAQILPGLALLPHQVRVLPAEATALVDAPDCDAVLVDGRRDLAQVRALTQLIRTTGTDAPVLLILTEGGLAVVTVVRGADVAVIR